MRAFAFFPAERVALHALVFCFFSFKRVPLRAFAFLVAERVALHAFTCFVFARAAPRAFPFVFTRSALRVRLLFVRARLAVRGRVRVAKPRAARRN